MNMLSPMQTALHADGPSPELAPEDRIYDWLIGSWDVRVVDYLDDGSKRENAGEWHFGYVLEGRAIQDVWISPPRSLRNSATSKECNRYGTSVRALRPNDRKWDVTWINPVSGWHDRLIARRVGKDIVQEGHGAKGELIRWVFTDIEKHSARWYGESSNDGGKTWKLGAQFFLTRRGR
jgi:uncharacterized protein